MSLRAQRVASSFCSLNVFPKSSAGRTGRILEAVSVSLDQARTIPWSVQDIRIGRQVVFHMHVHLVFVTKYRRDVLSELAIRGSDGDLRGRTEAMQRRRRSRPPAGGLSAAEADRVKAPQQGVSAGCCASRGREITGPYWDGVLWSPAHVAAHRSRLLPSPSATNERPRLLPAPKGRGFRRGS